jgi:hypothetical protein
MDGGICGVGVSAEGILSARSDSIFWRIPAAEGIVYSPYVRLFAPVDVNSLLHHPQCKAGNAHENAEFILITIYCAVYLSNALTCPRS